MVDGGWQWFRHQGAGLAKSCGRYAPTGTWQVPLLVSNHGARFDASSLHAPGPVLPVARVVPPVARDFLPVARVVLPVARDFLPVVRVVLPVDRDFLPVARVVQPVDRAHSAVACTQPTENES